MGKRIALSAELVTINISEKEREREKKERKRINGAACFLSEVAPHLIPAGCILLFFSRGISSSRRAIST